MFSQKCKTKWTIPIAHIDYIIAEAKVSDSLPQSHIPYANIVEK